MAEDYMSIWNHPGEWTEEDYLALPRGAAKIELIDGRLLVSPMPSRLHQKYMQRLAVHLDAQSPDALDVVIEVNLRVGTDKILIPDLLATYEPGDTYVHDAKHVLLVGEIVSPSNRGEEWMQKSRFYARAEIPWYLLVERDAEGGPTLILGRREGECYVEHARATPGQELVFPEPLGTMDPAVLLRSR
ncbi:Uma2 family endonuclease [Thermomonospora echinospora]|uniref:Uma2 family endonuclease n=1 Tax=Thermomonospora echinospora TaxID=1992 RepID=UPI00135A883C|nr:Uma2 family endonuclease [Thermomonospora echinospora]